MELDKGCNNLKNVEQISSSVSNVEHINSELNGNMQISSSIDNLVQVMVTQKYTGITTDSIEVIVDDATKEISANILQIQYNSVSEFPSTGSDKLLYVDLSDNSIWRYDTILEDYVQIGKVGTSVTVGGIFVENLAFESDPQGQIDSLEINKVDKEEGKGLSSNDYTDADKSKLADVETGAEVNVIEQINVNGVPQTVSDKVVNLTITDSSLIGNKINVTMDTVNYIMTISLLNASDGVLSSSTVDFPLESVVVNASYSNGTLTLVLQNGNTVDVDISSIISGLVPDSRTINGKALTNDIVLTADDIGALSDSTYIPTSLADLTEDENHRTVTDVEKQTWNAKADESDLPRMIILD